jgi:hypothetical protein
MTVQPFGVRFSLEDYTVARALVRFLPERPQVRHEMMMLKTEAMPPWNLVSIDGCLIEDCDYHLR